MLLSKGINDYLEAAQDGLGRGQLWITVYMNKRGLAETLAATNHCTLDEFDEFVIGFNQSSPLYSIVDVGNGKEAADAKIKGQLSALQLLMTSHPRTCRDLPCIYTIPSNPTDLLWRR
jgi:hypothetical protein